MKDVSAEKIAKKKNDLLKTTVFNFEDAKLETISRFASVVDDYINE